MNPAFHHWYFDIFLLNEHAPCNIPFFISFFHSFIISIFITQDGSGSRTASFNAAFKFVGGTAPTLTTTAAAVDRIDYVILSSNVIHCAVSLDVK